MDMFSNETGNNHSMHATNARKSISQSIYQSIDALAYIFYTKIKL